MIYLSICPRGIISLTLMARLRQDPEDKAGGLGGREEGEQFAPKQTPVSRPGRGADGKTGTELEVEDLGSSLLWVWLQMSVSMSLSGACGEPQTRTESHYVPSIPRAHHKTCRTVGAQQIISRRIYIRMGLTCHFSPPCLFHPL